MITCRFQFFASRQFLVRANLLGPQINISLYCKNKDGASVLVVVLVVLLVVSLVVLVLVVLVVILEFLNQYVYFDCGQGWRGLVIDEV
jgi:hypothetical protein